MKIIRVNWQIFELPYSNLIKSRKGILLYLQNEQGRESYGEISPLPGFSHESLEDASDQIREFAEQIYSCTWTEDALENFDSSLFFPSVAFGIESALWQLFSPSRTFECSYCPLLLGSVEEILKKAEQCLDEGFTTLKVKLGHLNYVQAKRVIDCLKNRAHLRLDINQKWNYKEALHFFSTYQPDDFAYIEEPLDQVDKLIDFPYPFALDETLQNSDWEKYATLSYCKALIIKPTLIGGISRIKNFSRFGKPLILSSSYESGVGIFQIAAIANRLQLLDTEIGIDTYGYLREDLICPRLQITSNKLSLPDQLKLKEVYAMSCSGPRKTC